MARTSSSAPVAISPHKLDPLKELELLRQQQEQLQQLQKLEKRLKQTPSVSSEKSNLTATTFASTNSSSSVISCRAETVTDNSRLKYSHGSQSTTVQANNKTNTPDQGKGDAIKLLF